MRGRAHCAYHGLLIAVPTVVGTRGDAAVQIHFGQECKPIEADGNLPLICQVHRCQISPTPRCYQHGNSCDNDSVAANKSNVCGHRSSIDANNAEDTDDAEDVTEDADNARRYAEIGKNEQQGDRYVGDISW